jgi:histidinol-phosphate aminotransferase
MTAVDSRARASVKNLVSYKPGTPIEEVKRERKLSSVIKLASNENALGPSPKALAALKKAAGNLHRYPDSTCRELRAALAKSLKVAPEALIFGNGSDEIIVLALRAFVDPGDEVMVASPTFLIYEQQARACGASVTVVPLKEFRYDLAAMRAAITPHTKLVFIANPDNPTGTYVTKRELETFLNALDPHTIVFLDEAYYEFVDEADYPQSLRYVLERPVIVTRTFSKAYGLAGLRIGYGIAQPGLAAAMNAVREPFNVNSLAQAGAVAALADGAFLARTRRTVQEGKRRLVKTLERLKLRHVPSATNFILIELGPRASDVAAALLSRGVIVREMSAWKLPGCIRVTVGTPAENARFIRELKIALGSGLGARGASP